MPEMTAEHRRELRDRFAETEGDSWALDELETAAWLRGATGERERCAKLPREVYEAARGLARWSKDPGELVDDIAAAILKE